MDLLVGLGLGIGISFLNSDSVQSGGAGAADLFDQSDDDNVASPPVGQPIGNTRRRTIRSTRSSNPKYIPKESKTKQPVLYKSRIINGVEEFFDGLRGWRNAEDVTLENNIKRCSDRCKRREAGRKISKSAKEKLNSKRKKKVKEVVCVFHKKRKETGKEDIQLPVTKKIYDFIKSIVKL